VAGTGRVHLVRHGESRWNVRRLVQGQSPAGPLSALGREQTEAAARLLGERLPGAWVCVSSDLLRARQTAAVLAGRVGIPVRFDPALRERRFGDLEGRRLDVPEVSREVARLWAEPDYSRPGAESLREFSRRVCEALVALYRRHPEQDVVVVTHGGPIRVATAWLEGRPLDEVGFPPVANGAVYSYGWPADAVAGSVPSAAASAEAGWPSGAADGGRSAG
jgi:probable phosphoglycerate mutase